MSDDYPGDQWWEIEFEPEPHETGELKPIPEERSTRYEDVEFLDTGWVKGIEPEGDWDTDDGKVSYDYIPPHRIVAVRTVEDRE